MSHNDKSETHILGVLMVCFFLLLGLHIHTASDNNHPFTAPSLEYSSTASLCADRHSDEEHLPYLLPSCRKIMISAQYTPNKALKLLNRFHPGVAFPTMLLFFFMRKRNFFAWTQFSTIPLSRFLQELLIQQKKDGKKRFSLLNSQCFICSRHILADPV